MGNWPWRRGGGLRQACHDGAAVRDTWRKEEGIRLKLFKKQIFEIQSVIHKGFASNPIDQTKGNSFPKTMISETNVHIAEINSISLRKRENWLYYEMQGKETLTEWDEQSAIGRRLTMFASFVQSVS